MDKTEYQMKLDEINRLVDAQDYEGALEIVDSIEWKRVKSVRTLCMVADIYEVNGELDESMRILQLAYKRSSVGKMILYRQVELALKMKKYDDAVKYYNKYLETASNDTSKYILKYKIYKAQKAPLEDQIKILEEYKEREYTERWVYELARLYKKADNEYKCIETCDDLILWFGDGKYVTKAMELKMTYVPLSPSQKIKYDQRDRSEEEVIKFENKPKEKPQQKVPTLVTSEKVAGISAAALANLKKTSLGLNTEPAEIVETKEEVSKPVEEEIINLEVSEPMEEAAATSEPEMVREEPKAVDPVQLQEKLAKSFQEVLSGINRSKVVNAFEMLGKSVGSELPQETLEEENMDEYLVTELEPETMDETIISAEKGEAIAHRTEIPETVEKEEKKEEKIAEKPEDKEVVSVQELDLEALFAETSGELAKMAGDIAEQPVELEVVEEEVSEEPTEEESEEEAVEPEAAEEEISEEPTEEESEEEAVEPEAAEEEVPEEPVSEKPAEESVVEVQEEDFDAQAAMSAFEASLMAGLNNIPGLEDYIPEEPVKEVEEVVEPEEEEAVEPAIEEAVMEEAETEVPVVEEPEDSWEEDDVKIAPPIGHRDEFDLEAVLMANLEGTLGVQVPEEETVQEDVTVEEVASEEVEPEEAAVEEVISEEPQEEPEQEMDLVEKLMMEADNEPTDYTRPEEETPEDKRRRILNATRPECLTEEQKSLFSYFSKVPGMDEQILDAINSVYEHADERTSRRGNIAIMGSHGTGKTRLSEGLVKAICKQFGITAVKYACLDASDMNQKDPATVIGKMAGGFLLIERASFMTKETIEKLSRAMDFRTDSLILLIEDDKPNMRKLLAEYPAFAEKFDTVISIPVFTNDELVTFARTYAKENGYRMDEMGVLALYTLIGDNQREDEPITVGKVKEMVDRAIRHASSARLGRRISKRHTDEDGRILLYEKDFD